MGKRRVEAEVLLELFSTCFLNKLKASLTGSRWDGAGTEVAFDAFLKSYLGAPSIPVTKSKASSSGGMCGLSERITRLSSLDLTASLLPPRRLSRCFSLPSSRL